MCIDDLMNTLKEVMYVSILIMIWLKLSFSSFIPESARWLVAKERYKDAYHILRKNASMNGHELSETVMHDVEISSSDTINARPHIVDLLRSRSMAIITLSCWFMW